MKLQTTAIFLACAMLAAMLTGCKKEEVPTPSTTDSTTEATQATVQGKHHITVESVEISLSELKAQNYTVPVYVRLDKNAGVNYSEWGLIVDKRCTFTVNENAEDLAFTVYHSINEKEHFIWTAWASGTEVSTKTGNLICLNVTLPRAAAAGDSFLLEYADWSKADTPHLWNSPDNKWAESGDVTWTDGIITITQ